MLKPQDDAPLNSFRPFPGWIRWTPSAWTSSGLPGSEVAQSVVSIDANKLTSHFNWTLCNSVQPDKISVDAATIFDFSWKYRIF